MGMSATQARYYMLTAKQSDLEFQGQQINQSRTTLSNQTNNLYSQLQDLSVPVPPSTTDYTTVQYTGTDQASTFTLGNIVPNGTNYNVELKYTKTGHYLTEGGTQAVTQVESTMGIKSVTFSTQTQTDKVLGVGDALTETSKVNTGDTIMKHVSSADEANNMDLYELVTETDADGKEVKMFKHIDSFSDASKTGNVYGKIVKTDGDGYTPKIGDYKAGSETNWTSEGLTKNTILNGDYYYLDDNGDPQHFTESELLEYFTQNSDGTYSPIDGKTLYSKSGSGKYKNPDYKTGTEGYYVSGNLCMTFDEAQKQGKFGSSNSTQKTIDSYMEAIANMYSEYMTTDADGNSTPDTSKIKEDFSVYFETSETGKLVPHFVRNEEVSTALVDSNGTSWCTSYDYTAGGQYTASETVDNCQLVFDTSGRITEIKIPTKTDKDGNPLSYKSIELTATSVIDDAAYKDAYAEYEYDKYKYDQEQQNINAQISIIQQEDKSLELKLERLDNERTQITTEMEALDKVINDNIEKSYKTFSG